MSPSAMLACVDPACLASLRAACGPPPASSDALVTISLALLGFAAGVLAALVGASLAG